jgi:hypothetical protein
MFQHLTKKVIPMLSKQQRRQKPLVMNIFYQTNISFRILVHIFMRSWRYNIKYHDKIKNKFSDT